MKAAPFFNDDPKDNANGRAVWQKTSDGIRLRMACWNEKGPAGTIFLFLGRTAYVEAYGHLAADFETRGFATLAIDWRGQGLSDRLTDDPKTGHVESFTQYQIDVQTMIQTAAEMDLPKPWYMVGISMGGCIGQRALAQGFPAAACAFAAPMWKIKLNAFERLAAPIIANIAQKLGRGAHYAPGQSGKSAILNVSFGNNIRTGDQNMFNYFVRQAQLHPELIIGGPSMAWLHSAFREIGLLNASPLPKVPCLSFCGDNDALVDLNRVKQRMEMWPDGQFAIVPNGKHDLLNDTPAIRSKMISEICTFFESAA